VAATLQPGVRLTDVPRAPALPNLPDEVRCAALKQHAQRLESRTRSHRDPVLDGAGWLADLLITPVCEGRLELTPEGEAAVVAM
jgi:hypothetical protein